jgi:hypothetical protein
VTAVTALRIGDHFFDGRPAGVFSNYAAASLSIVQNGPIGRPVTHPTA